MARNKIDFGIDLGTTNSSICCMERGEQVMFKTDVLKDTMPSCISVNKKGSIKIGDSAYNVMKQDKRRATKSWHIDASNAYVEFKRTMATDTKYKCSILNTEFTSEELSAEVLKTLKSFVPEQFSSVVITVPAKFTVNQKTATMEAAKMAGFSHCELLQEPIAASMAYGVTTQEKNGLWMVFDFGGGTFDAALIKVEDGIMQVFDTEGDNYLGGKNLDYAIVDNIIIPYLQKNYSIDGYLQSAEKKEVMRDAMKTYVEEARIQLSYRDHEDIISNLGDLGEDEDGEEIELDLTLSQKQVFDVIRPYYQKAVDICKTLIQRNNIDSSQISKLILVGGPTKCPLIQDMLSKQISKNVESSVDPMTVVARGAALYASTLNADMSTSEIQQDVVKIDVYYESTTVELIEYATVALANDVSVKNKFVEFVRGDMAWSSGKVEIDTRGDVVALNLVEGKANSFSIVCYDEQGNKVPCFPNEITIIQGTKVGAAPLPYFIGIEIWNEENSKLVFEPIIGLEKNRPLPATGVLNAAKTTSDIRPGNVDDKLVIPVYQADEFEKGASSKLYEYVTNVVIDGSDVVDLIPARTSVDITIKADSSEMMTLEAFFPSLDFTVTKQLNTNKKQSLKEATDAIEENFVEAQRTLQMLEENGVDVSDLKMKLNDVKKENNNNSETKMVLQHQKEVLRDIERRDSDSAFDRIEKELKELFKMVEADQNKYGDFNTGKMLEQLRSMADDAISKKDAKMAKDVLEQLRSLDVNLALVDYFVAWIMAWNERFNSFAWKDSKRARQLINQAISIINSAPSVESLRPYVTQIIDLLPPTDIPYGAEGRLTK